LYLSKIAQKAQLFLSEYSGPELETLKQMRHHAVIKNAVKIPNEDS
jgi:hypothetical protein